jgi:hypothetical protein
MAFHPNSGFGSKFSGMLSSLFNWIGCYHHWGSVQGQLHHWLAISPDICFDLLSPEVDLEVGYDFDLLSPEVDLEVGLPIFNVRCSFSS